MVGPDGPALAHDQDGDVLMLDLALADISVPEPDPGRWQQQLKDVLGKMSRMLMQRRGIARIAMDPRQAS